MENLFKINLNEFFEWLNEELGAWDGGFDLENMFGKDYDEIDETDLKDFNIKQYLMDQEIDVIHSEKWDLILTKINQIQ